MPEINECLIVLSCILFLLTLFTGKHRKYYAAGAWITLIIVFISGVPEWIAESNILYPLMAVLSIPFLVVTLILLHRENNEAFSLTRAAAIAWIIYAPFTFFTGPGNALILLVVDQTAFIIQTLGYNVTFSEWNILQRGMFRVEIILACTGIQAIAIMLGVAAAVKTTWKQKIFAFLLVAPTIYILNLFRNAAVVIAYTDQWFSFLPDISGNPEIGYSTFFWAHNIFAELLALLLLIAITFGLFKLIPELAEFAIRLVNTYELELIKIWTIIRNTPDKGR